MTVATIGELRTAAAAVDAGRDSGNDLSREADRDACSALRGAVVSWVANDKEGFAEVGRRALDAFQVKLERWNAGQIGFRGKDSELAKNRREAVKGIKEDLATEMRRGGAEGYLAKASQVIKIIRVGRAYEHVDEMFGLDKRAAMDLAAELVDVDFETSAVSFQVGREAIARKIIAEQGRLELGQKDFREMVWLYLAPEKLKAADNKVNAKLQYRRYVDEGKTGDADRLFRQWGADVDARRQAKCDAVASLVDNAKGVAVNAAGASLGVRRAVLEILTPELVKLAESVKRDLEAESNELQAKYDPACKDNGKDNGNGKGNGKGS